MSQISDEETPLLTDQSQHTISKKQRTPLPWRQFSILLLLQVSDPMTSQAIAPFLPQLIKDIGVTDGTDSHVGYYVGLLHSLYYLTQSRLSDKISREIVVLTGLFGLSLSMWYFGLSRSFWSLVISRCLNGALNGNIGVMKSMTIEITDSTNIAQAFGILPITWAIGTTVGPSIGGSLTRPTERFPRIFGDSQFLKEHPYFLPWAVPVTVTALSWLITLMFLKETKKLQMSLRQYLFGGIIKDHKPNSDLQVHGLQDDPAPDAVNRQLPLRALLTRLVLIAAGSYATFSLVDIAFRAVSPVFYAMPIEMGGLDLDPPAIGTILALSGMLTGIMQLILFAPMNDWLGAKATFLVTVSLCLPATAMFPMINAAARVYGFGNLVWFYIGLQRLLFAFADLAFGVTFMYIGAAAPNKESIGATNGLAQMIVSVMRAVGPATVNSAFSLSIEKNIMGGYLAYWVIVVMVGLTLWVGYLLPKKLWNE